ncbi:hypothetical protein PanWU01x14_184490 [Parasponia andersonii]|uniref:Uncharacterized protein n=1 Tax=Parasponia andersonii TaxID=3476 RepID=A0A2P5C4I6_PARAD|nr:hypothetical protein PanWU01x14_184490 [Parasponia andersonii]
MAPKNSSQTYRTSGLNAFEPNVSSSSSSRGRHLNESSEMETAAKSIFKDKQGRFSSQFLESHKAEEFVDNSTGRLGYKEESKYTNTYKYDDKENGYTDEYYQTQVKFGHVFL